jgi:pSer/pThr/pTyr-binding forkhead associated (FHA) protein
MDERTMDAFTPSENALGVLVILQSDDPALVHQRIEISKSVTSLGRKADNDIIFAKDSPVSRHHAVIEERGRQLFLSEVISADDSGQSKRPAYGTFVNGSQIQDTVLLQDGDEIQLGKRVRIRVEAIHTPGNEDKTVDQMPPSGDEKTVDYNTQ